MHLKLQKFYDLRHTNLTSELAIESLIFSFKFHKHQFKRLKILLRPRPKSSFSLRSTV